MVSTLAVSAVALDFAAVDLGEGLAVSVFHFEAARDLLDCPKRREASLRHGQIIGN